MLVHQAVAVKTEQRVVCVRNCREGKRKGKGTGGRKATVKRGVDEGTEYIFEDEKVVKCERKCGNVFLRHPGGFWRHLSRFVYLEDHHSTSQVLNHHQEALS